jgi:catechol 2,3-dioxygenase-like lactoylglutathione lyase family enzyme
MTGGLRLARFVLNCRSPETSALFFIEALGFRRVAAETDASITLSLGPTRLDLTPAGPGARPYPKTLPPWSARFQHLAIVTADMAAAMERLRQADGWTAISRNGPERLPPSSGGVTAFKFRGPDGHPLELISFPGGDNAPRIDHSAISVADSARGIAFYEALGLTVGTRSLNRGPEQDRLDGVAGAQVEVTALIPPAARTPHIELLCYGGEHRRGPVAGLADVAATRLILAGARGEPGSRPSRTLMLRDPDGHLVGLEA